jgi:flagellar motility protein MotE (MotC chaperone)
MSDINNSSEEKILEKESTPSFLSKIIHLGVLPLIYAIILGSIILHFSGESFYSQFKWVKGHTKVLQFKSEKPEKKVSSKKATSSKDSNKTDETSGSKNVSEKDQTATDNNTQVDENDDSENIDQESTVQTDGSSAAESLSSMEPSVAAKLLINMKETNALTIIKQLKPQMQSTIIAAMPSEDGARMTEALTNGNEPATTTTTTTQLYQYMKPDQIANVLNGIKNNEVILNQIKQMDPNTASKVMTKLNPEIAGWVVTYLKP